jgi:hypothetical protein
MLINAAWTIGNTPIHYTHTIYPIHCIHTIYTLYTLYTLYIHYIYYTIYYTLYIHYIHYILTPPSPYPIGELALQVGGWLLLLLLILHILYIYTYIHIYIHTYIHTHIHTYIHTHIHTYTHTYIHTCIHTYIHTGELALQVGGDFLQAHVPRVMSSLITALQVSNSMYVCPHISYPHISYITSNTLHHITYLIHLYITSCAHLHTSSPPCRQHTYPITCEWMWQWLSAGIHYIYNNNNSYKIILIHL